jgi:rhodanese-related sulfurtransferase
MDDLRKTLTGGGLGPNDLLLDIREPDEFQEFRIEGATNIPMADVAANPGQIKKYSKVYLYCLAGGRAGRLMKVLQAQGAADNVVCISTTGMRNWAEQGYPVISG